MSIDRYLRKMKKRFILMMLIELREKINFWLLPVNESKREKIVHNAYEKCIKMDYSYDPIVKKYLDYFHLGG